MAWPSTSARTKNWGTEILTDGDLEGQFDLLHSYFNDSLNASTGHGHTGGTSDGPKLSLTAAVTGTLPVTNGGTGQATLAAFLNLIYPIGSVYINVSDSTSPATLLGFGTWSALGAGRMIVGFDSGDTNFDSAGETGGANTVTLTTTELPAHTHSVGTVNNSSAAGTANSAVEGQSTNDSLNTGSAGSGAAFSVLNKYVVCYVWKRTA